MQDGVSFGVGRSTEGLAEYAQDAQYHWRRVAGIRTDNQRSLAAENFKLQFVAP